MRENICPLLFKKKKVKCPALLSLCHNITTSVIHDWYLSCQLSPDQLSKSQESLFLVERSVVSVWPSPFIASSHHVQSPFVSRSWRQKLWCRLQGTVVSGRHDPRTWPHKPPNPLPDAHTPVVRHCHHGNCPRAFPTGRCRHRACGLWRHCGNAAGSGDAEAQRGGPAVGFWSMSDLRGTERWEFKREVWKSMCECLCLSVSRSDT